MNKLTPPEPIAGEVGGSNFFQALLDNMSEGVSLSTEDGIIVYTNPAEDRMFGYAAGELVGQHVSVQNAYPPEDNQRRVEEVIRKLKDRGLWEGEWQNRRKDGSEFFTASRITSVEVAGIRHWLCVQRDITEQRAATLRQQDNEARLSIALSAASQGVWDWDLVSGEMVYCDRAKQIYGLSPEDEVTYQRIRDATHPDDLPNTSALLKRALDPAVRDRSSYEYRIVRPDGSIAWALAYGEAVFDESDGTARATRYVGTIRDITQEKDAQERLRKSEGLLALFVEDAPVGIAFFDRAMRYQAVSRRFAQDLGLESHRGLLGRSHYEVFPDVPQEWRAVHDRVLAGEELSAAEDPFPRADGRLDWVRWAMKPWFNADGGIGGAILFSEVITEDVERRQALESALAARSSAESRLRTLTDALPALISHVTAEQRYDFISRTYEDWLKVPREQALGRYVWEVVGQGPYGIVKPRIEAALKGERQVFEAEIDYPVGRKDVRAEFIPERGPDGSVTGFFAMVQDISELKTKERALLDSERRMSTVLESVSDCFYAVDAEWRVTLFNRAAEEFFGVSRTDALGRSLWTVLPPSASSEVATKLHEAMARGAHAVHVTPSLVHPGKWIELRVSPKEGGGLAVSFTDVSERIAADRARDLLVNELNHRVKNTLAVVQSIAQHSFRGGDPQEQVGAFEGRLTALAAAHNLLTRRNWERAILPEVVGESLRPFSASRPEAFEIAGPPLEVTAKTAVNLALCLNELATNAVKYGALSSDGGNVSLTWSSKEGDGFQLWWTESGGPPVQPPAREGFGTRMIKRVLAVEMGGSVELRFDRSGLSCLVRAPVRSRGPAEVA